MNMKKILSVVLAIVLAFGLMVQVSAAEPTVKYKGEMGGHPNINVQRFLIEMFEDDSSYGIAYCADSIELEKTGNNIELTAYSDTYEPLVLSFKNGVVPKYNHSPFWVDGKAVECDEVYEFTEWYTDGEKNQEPNGEIFVGFKDDKCYFNIILKGNQYDWKNGGYSGAKVGCIHSQAVLDMVEEETLTPTIDNGNYKGTGTAVANTLFGSWNIVSLPLTKATVSDKALTLSFRANKVDYTVNAKRVSVQSDGTAVYTATDGNKDWNIKIGIDGSVNGELNYPDSQSLIFTMALTKA